MFRPMRRSKQQVTEKECIACLNEAVSGALGYYADEPGKNIERDMI